MKVQLRIRDAEAGKRVAILDSLPAVVGRSSQASVYLNDRFVSRRHCEIDQLDDTLVVRDLGSSHGTFLNGLEVSQANLMPGDRLALGNSSVSVHYGSGALEQKVKGRKAKKQKLQL